MTRVIMMEGNARKNNSGRKQHVINMEKSKERTIEKTKEKHQEGINKIN